MANHTTSQFIDAIGPDALLSLEGMTERNLRHVRSVGYFAARWYRPIKELAESRRILCPLDAFSWQETKPIARQSSTAPMQ